MIKAANCLFVRLLSAKEYNSFSQAEKEIKAEELTGYLYTNFNDKLNDYLLRRFYFCGEMESVELIAGENLSYMEFTEAENNSRVYLHSPELSMDFETVKEAEDFIDKNSATCALYTAKNEELNLYLIYRIYIGGQLDSVKIINRGATNYGTLRVQL